MNLRVPLAILLAALATIGGASFPALASQSPSEQRMVPETMKGDLADRSADIHWPAGFSPEMADLFAHNEATMRATCNRVWEYLITATKWPEWYPNSKDVRIRDGAERLDRESTFTWITFGVSVESTINEFVPFSRIGWYGYLPGSQPTNYHAWFLAPMPDGCRVVTEEVGKGARAKQIRKTDESRTHRGHELWLAALKRVAEGR